VSARHLALFALVAVLWGIPYLLIAVALTGFDAPFVAWARVARAAAVLVAVVGPRLLAHSLRGRLLAVSGFAVVQFSVPLVLMAEAERSVPSSLVACLIASEPLRIAILALRMDRAERIGAVGALGLLVGLAGVSILLGAELGGSSGGAALTLLPLVLVAPPAQPPGVRAVVALAALALVCTAVAFPLWFALISRVGAVRAALVTYASPLVAVALGIVLLGEQLGRLAPLGLVLILAGSLLASRTDRPSRVETVAT
jgi:drug/metabolite transporter (DMT)-like permease